KCRSPRCSILPMREPSAGRAAASPATSTSTTTAATPSGAPPHASFATIWPFSPCRRDTGAGIAGRPLRDVSTCASGGIRAWLALLALRAQRRRSALCEVSAAARAAVRGLRGRRCASRPSDADLTLYAARAPALNEIALNGREKEHRGDGDHRAGGHDHA